MKSLSRNVRSIRMLQTVQIKQREAKTLMIKRIQYLERIFMDLIDQKSVYKLSIFLYFSSLFYFTYIIIILTIDRVSFFHAFARWTNTWTDLPFIFRLKV